TAEALARTDLLRRAGLRLPWGVAATGLLRARGLLADSATGPCTAEELAALAE
ncbi:ABC transporter ATP-binding protein, partial [Streptomyces sp. SID5926]|nr:ABC transporter ATP-binding protein [Streptomyces sp. SID5926]